jgi:hypothetical protein
MTPARLVAIAVGLTSCLAAARTTHAQPTLSLTPDRPCCPVGDTLHVDVVMTGQTETIVGGQLFLDYDASKLTLVSVDPGPAPFTLELFECSPVVIVPPAACAPAVGLVDYAVGVDLFGGGTAADSTLARLTFVAATECCDVAGLVGFRVDGAGPNLLTTVEGASLAQALVDLPAVSLDGTAPVLACPADVTIACDEDDQPPATGTATATDNCDPAPLVTFDDMPTPGACPGSFTIFRTWTATDACGLETTCVQTITVVDDVAPEVTDCPGDVLAAADAGVCGTDVSWAAALATDACDPEPVVLYDVDEDRRWPRRRHHRRHDDLPARRHPPGDGPRGGRVRQRGPRRRVPRRLRAGRGRRHRRHHGPARRPRPVGRPGPAGLRRGPARRRRGGGHHRPALRARGLRAVPRRVRLHRDRDGQRGRLQQQRDSGRVRHRPTSASPTATATASPTTSTSRAARAPTATATASPTSARWTATATASPTTATSRRGPASTATGT